MSREVDLGQIVPNIQVGTTTTGSPSTPASVVNVGTDLNPILNFKIPKGDAGAIKMQIVVELPLIGQEDTIYLVPLEEPETQENRYAEYVWVNNQWELLGKIGIQVDLTDYVKNTDYATSNKGGVFKTGFGIQALEGTIAGETYTYNDYQGWRDLLVVSKGTLENVIAGKDLTTKAYVDNLVGDVETLLTALDIGGGI